MFMKQLLILFITLNCIDLLAEEILISDDFSIHYDSAREIRKDIVVGADPVLETVLGMAFENVRLVSSDGNEVRFRSFFDDQENLSQNICRLLGYQFFDYRFPEHETIYNWNESQAADVVEDPAQPYGYTFRFLKYKKRSSMLVHKGVRCFSEI